MPYRKFIILSSPRSGTHMLRTALGGHENIVCLSELFNPHWYPDVPYDENTPTRQILDAYIWPEYPPSIQAAGFCIHRSGAPMGGHENLWDVLDSENELYVISLRRRNLLRRYLSFRVMREDKGQEPTAKNMSVEELNKELTARESEIETFDQRYGHRLLKLYYEDLVDDFDIELAKAQTFLGLPVRQLAPATERNPFRPLSEAIVNRDELYEAFKDTHWDWFFEKALPMDSRVSTEIDFDL